MVNSGLPVYSGYCPPDVSFDPNFCIYFPSQELASFDYRYRSTCFKERQLTMQTQPSPAAADDSLSFLTPSGKLLVVRVKAGFALVLLWLAHIPPSLRTAVFASSLPK